MALLGDYYAPRIRVPQMIQRGKTQVVEVKSIEMGRLLHHIGYISVIG